MSKHPLRTFGRATEHLNVRVSAEERELVEHAAALQERSISNWIRLAIRQKLKQELLSRKGN